MRVLNYAHNEIKVNFV